MTETKRLLSNWSLLNKIEENNLFFFLLELKDFVIEALYLSRMNQSLPGQLSVQAGQSYRWILAYKHDSFITINIHLTLRAFSEQQQKKVLTEPHAHLASLGEVVITTSRIRINRNKTFHNSTRHKRRKNSFPVDTSPKYLYKPTLNPWDASLGTHTDRETEKHSVI